MADPATFPFVPQTQYVDIPEAPLTGDLWEGELYNERVTRGFIAKVTNVSQQNTIIIGANNPTDAVGVTIDGGLIQVVAGASAAATALLLEAAIEAAPFLVGKLGTVTVSTATLTVNWIDYVAHTVVEYSPAATTATVATPVVAVGQEQLLYGMGVVKKLPITTAMNTAIAKPTSLTQVFAGVLIRTHGTNLPPAQIEAAGFDPKYLCPGYAYSVAAQNLGVVVDYVGEAPLVGDPVYLVMTGANAGLWSKVDGAVSQVTSGTMAFNGTDDVGVIVDGLAPIFVASNVSNTQTNVDLVAAWNGNPAYAAIATASSVTATFTLTFLDDQVHTVVAYSPATADITGIVNSTAAVAATGKLIPNYSWGRPSITVGDPTRAFLRLANP